jgi:hypothetical protein
LVAELQRSGGGDLHHLAASDRPAEVLAAAGAIY